MSDLLTAFRERLGEGKSLGPAVEDPRITGRHTWDSGCYAQQVLDNRQWNMVRTCKRNFGSKWL